MIDAIEKGRRPVCDIETGHLASNVSLLGMLSYKLGRSVEWNGEKERFDGDEADHVAAFVGELIGVSLAGDVGAAGQRLRAARSDPRLMVTQVRRAFERWLVQLPGIEVATMDGSRDRRWREAVADPGDGSDTRLLQRAGISGQVLV